MRTEGNTPPYLVGLPIVITLLVGCSQTHIGWSWYWCIFPLFLLHIPLSHYKHSALPHLLNAAKRLILIHWKSLRIPSELDWLGKVTKIMEAKEWVATCKGTRERFDAIWASWWNYFSGQAPVSSSLDIALLTLAGPTFGQLVQAKPKSGPEPDLELLILV